MPSPSDFASLQPAALYQQAPPNLDAAYLYAPTPATPTAADLSAISNSDPNGFISSDIPSSPASTSYPIQDPSTLGAGQIPNQPAAAQGQVVQGPDGNPLVLPPNTGADNTFAGQQPAPAVNPGKDGGDSQTDGQSTAPGFWSFYRSVTGFPKGTLVPQKHVLDMQKMYAETFLKAKNTPPARMVSVNGHQWIQQGNTLLPADQKPVSTQQIELPDGTLARYVTDSNSPDYLKAQRVYDASTGQPLRVQTASNRPVAPTRIQLNDGTIGMASSDGYFQPVTDASGNIIKGRLPGMAAPVAVAAPTPYSNPNAGSIDASSMSPEAIKQAYKSGQLSRQAAQNMLIRVHGYRP